jgi:hypothetical protein
MHYPPDLTLLTVLGSRCRSRCSGRRVRSSCGRRSCLETRSENSPSVCSHLLAMLSRSVEYRCGNSRLIMDCLLMKLGNAKVLNVDTGDDLLTETGMSNYEYTYVCHRNMSKECLLTSDQNRANGVPYRIWYFRHPIQLLFKEATT